WLGRLVRVLGIDALTIFVTSGESRALAPMYSWVDGPGSNAADLATQHLAWAERTLALQDAVLVWGSDTLSGSRQLRLSSQSLEVKAGGAIPLAGEGEPLGAFTLR